MMKLLFGILFIFNFSNAQAFETMIRKGYSSCIACHYSPAGGGILTDYGKMVSTSLSAIAEEEYIEGTFKKKMRMDGKLDHAVFFRLAKVKKKDYDETFPMQGDYAGVYQGEKTTFIAQLARAPERENDEDEESTDKPSEMEKYYFRELKAIYQFSEEKFLTVGRQKQNLGPSLEDHTIFNKSLNRFNITDLTTVVAFDYVGEERQFTLSAFLPNSQEEIENAESGIKIEGRTLFGVTQVGSGVLVGKTESIDRIAYNLFAKIPFSAFVLMVDGIHAQRTADSQTFDQNTTWGQISYFPLDSLELSLFSERVDRTSPFEYGQSRQGGGVNFKLTRNLSFRTDYKKTILSNRNEEMLISQLFLNWW